MRPARLRSSRVNLVPWYSVEATAPSRHSDLLRAVVDDLNASLPNGAEEIFLHRDCQLGECSQAPKRSHA